MDDQQDTEATADREAVTQEQQRVREARERAMQGAAPEPLPEPGDRGPLMTATEAVAWIATAGDAACAAVVGDRGGDAMSVTLSLESNRLHGRAAAVMTTNEAMSLLEDACRAGRVPARGVRGQWNGPREQRSEAIPVEDWAYLTLTSKRDAIVAAPRPGAAVSEHWHDLRFGRAELIATRSASAVAEPLPRQANTPAARKRRGDHSTGDAKIRRALLALLPIYRDMQPSPKNASELTQRLFENPQAADHLKLWSPRTAREIFSGKNRRVNKLAAVDPTFVKWWVSLGE
jgi:hypothetical protein